MKKLLGILSTLGFSVTAASTVIACGCLLSGEQQKVVDEILKAEITDQVAFETSAQTYFQKITGDFIQTFLDEETQANFVAKDFKALAITKSGGEKITDFDLSRPKAPFAAQIKFNYGLIKNQTLDLTLEVVVEDEQVVQDIKNVKDYSWEPSYLDSPSAILNQINAQFIKEKIKHSGVEWPEFFKDEKYQTKEIRVKNEQGEFISLNSESLKTAGVIEAQIVFDYGSKKDQTATLAIQGAFAEIQAHLTETETYQNGLVFLNIENYKSLEGISITGEKVQVSGNHVEGIAAVTAKEIGVATITIDAKNAVKKKTLTLNIKEKTPLADRLKVLEVEGSEANEARDVLAKVLDLNPWSGVTKDDVGVLTFKPASQLGTGEATIIADMNGPFSGQVVVKINSLPKTPLEDKLKVLEVDGTEANNEHAVLEKVLTLNSGSGVKEKDVEVQEIEKATQLKAGRAKIVANNDSVFIGDVAVTITALPKTELSDKLAILEVDGNQTNTPEAVIEKILALNPESGVLKTDVEIESFKKATQLKAGSAIIQAKANSTFTGQVPITITALDKTKLSDKITILEVDGNEVNNANAVVEKILELNSNSGVTKNDVEIINFQEATQLKAGSITIRAKADSIFIGQVSIVITALDKTKLSDKITILEVDGNEVNNANAVVEKILELNSNSGVTKNDVEITDFQAATQLKAGAITIRAKANSIFTGEVSIVITALDKTKLSDKLTILEVDGNQANTQEKALDQILSINPESGVAKSDVEITAFQPASQLVEGSAIITAKENSTFTGQVSIVITALEKIKLSDKITNHNVDGNEVNTANAVLDKILSLNPNSGVAKDDVEIEDFQAATQLSGGHAIIKAKNNSIFTGQVTIMIAALDKTKLSDKLLILEVDGNEANDSNAVLDKILSLNPNSGVAKSNVEITDFKPATQLNAGSATIKAKANSTFTGQVLVTITTLEKIKLNDKLTILEVDGNEANTANAVLDKILNLNPDSGVTKDDVEITDFQAADQLSAGSMTITAQENSIFTGQVTIAITALNKIKLSDKLKNLKVDGNEANNENAVLDKILSLNPNSGVTKNDVEITDFKAATQLSAGSAIIKAKNNSIFTGQVTIMITALEKTKLSDKLKNLEVDGNETNTNTTVLDKILSLNPNSGVTKNDVEITDFKAATQLSAGSATIKAKANSIFSGEVKITITALNKTKLSDKLTVLKVDGNQANTNTTVLDKILSLNPNSGVTKNDVEITDFKAATQLSAGSATIKAKANSIFSGEVKITITALNKTKLSDKLTVLKVDGNQANTNTAVLDKILSLNPNSGVTKDDVEITDFKAATPKQKGSAKIVAKSNSIFTGEVEIEISTLKEVKIVASLEKNKILSGSSTTLKIQNYAALGTVAITSDDLTEVKDHQNGTATITTKKGQIGESTITITASKAIEPLTLKLASCYSQSEIDYELDKNPIPIGDFGTLVIKNYDQLKGIDVITTSDKRFLKVESQGGGIYKITALQAYPGVQILKIVSPYLDQELVINLEEAH